MNHDPRQTPYPQNQAPKAGDSAYRPRGDEPGYSTAYNPGYHPQHDPTYQQMEARYGPQNATMTGQSAPMHSSDPHAPQMQQAQMHPSQIQQAQMQQAQMYPPIYPPQEPPSVFKSIMKVLGWALLLTVLLGGAVLATGWWTLNRTAQNAFSVDTQATILTAAPVIESLRKVNKQIFVEHYNMVDIDYSEAPEGWLGILPIEQSFVVLLKGRVAAGFDMSQLREEDVWVSEDGKRVQLTLPPPIIFEDNVNVDFENSRILVQQDNCPNFICEETIETYKNQIFPQGRKLLIESSQTSGIMEQAVETGQLYYENFLRAFGFEEVRVGVRTVIITEQE